MQDETQKEAQQQIFKRKRGFAAMPPDVRRRIAAMGGRESHRRGTGHEWTPQEAAAAGRIGGSR